MPVSKLKGGRSGPSRGQRAVVLTAVLALHLLLLGLLVIGKVRATPARAEPGFVQIGMLSAATSVTSKPPPPAMPSKLAALPVPSFALSLTADFEINAAALSSHCSTLDEVSAALLADPVALAAIRDAPPDMRSITDAVVMWNAGWSPASSPDDAPLGPVRAAIERTLSVVDDSCLDEVIAGPRFVQIPNGDETMFMVLGSGQWSWRQLLLAQSPDEIVNRLMNVNIPGLPF